jgi:hypothetical protein
MLHADSVQIVLFSSTIHAAAEQKETFLAKVSSSVLRADYPRLEAIIFGTGCHYA